MCSARRPTRGRRVLAAERHDSPQYSYRDARQHSRGDIVTLTELIIGAPGSTAAQHASVTARCCVVACVNSPGDAPAVLGKVTLAGHDHRVRNLRLQHLPFSTCCCTSPHHSSLAAGTSSSGGSSYAPRPLVPASSPSPWACDGESALRDA